MKRVGTKRVEYEDGGVQRGWSMKRMEMEFKYPVARKKKFQSRFLIQNCKKT